MSGSATARLSPEETLALGAAAAALGAPLDRGALERLEHFLGLLMVWNRRFRLTGDRDLATLARKHTVDSLAPVPRLSAAGMVIDIGTGGGFPGIVLGCARPDIELVLLEPRRRAATFLREAIRTIPLPHATVREQRGEDTARDAGLAERADVVIARALRLDLFLRLARPLVAPGGQVIAMQTPRIGEAQAERFALSVGFECRPAHNYRLPGGESRRLLVFARPPLPVDGP